MIEWAPETIGTIKERCPSLLERVDKDQFVSKLSGDGLDWFGRYSERVDINNVIQSQSVRFYSSSNMGAKTEFELRIDHDNVTQVTMWHVQGETRGIDFYEKVPSLLREAEIVLRGIVENAQ